MPLEALLDRLERRQTVRFEADERDLGTYRTARDLPPLRTDLAAHAAGEAELNQVNELPYGCHTPTPA